MSTIIKEEWLVENLIPTEEVHLIGGPSGAGKTTWALQFIQQWQSGTDFFGHKCHPVPFVYVALDRSERGAKRTFRRLGIDVDAFPLIPALEKDFKTVEQIVNFRLATHPETKVFFIEGLASLMVIPRGISEYSAVIHWVGSLVRLCQSKGITIFGVVHSPKTKEGDTYKNPRQRILGSVAWAAAAEMIFLIEPSGDDEVTPLRNLFLLPRDGAGEIFEMSFEDGRLSPVKEDAAKIVFELWFASLSAASDFTFESLAQIGMKKGFNPRTARRWLNAAISNGFVEKKGHGTYSKRLMN